MSPRTLPTAPPAPAEAGGKLLRLVQVSLLASTTTLTDLHRRTGVPLRAIHRLLGHTSYRELVTVESAFAALGADVLACRPDGSWVKIMGALPRPALTSTTALLDPASLAGSDPLLAVLRTLAHHAQCNAHRLCDLADIPYASARRLLTAAPMRVLSLMQRLLAALQVDLMVVGPLGDCLCVPRLDLKRPRGAERHRGHRTAARTHIERARHLGDLARQHGRALIEKSEIARLYRDHNMGLSDIARIAGIGRERVRCVLRMAGCETVSSKQLRLRRERASSLLTLMAQA